MKAVVLMAGKGTRMAKYYEGPKQLLPVKGKPVVEHALDQLPEEVDGLVFVVGGPHEQTIRDYFASGEYGGRKIEFVVQEEQLGLAHAFKCARENISGRWLGMVGDDIFGPKGMRGLVEHDMAVLASRVDHPEKFGVLVGDDDGYLVRSVEKPQEFISDLAWNGAMVMDEGFFEIEVAPSARGEFETPDVWMKLIESGRKIKIVEADFWLPINDKEQLEVAEQRLAD
jgi:glucose-1-phosphate thymidylyltransferase